MAEKVGVFSKLYLSPEPADSGTYVALEFLNGSGIGLQEQFVNANGLNGTRVGLAARTRRGNRQARGQLVTAPTPAELDLFLPWATGGTKSGNNIDVAETADVPARWLRTDRDGAVHLYDGVKVESFTLSASEGSPLQMTMQLAGVDEADSTTPTSPTALDVSAGPYMLTDCVASIGGTTYQFRSFQLQCDNKLETRFNNSVTPTSIKSTGCTASVSLGLPYGDAAAVYGSALAGVAVVATFTNGNYSLAITCSAVQAPRTPLPFGSAGMLTLDWSGEVRKTGSSPFIRFANDSTA